MVKREEKDMQHPFSNSSSSSPVSSLDHSFAQENNCNQDEKRREKRRGGDRKRGLLREAVTEESRQSMNKDPSRELDRETCM